MKKQCGSSEAFFPIPAALIVSGSIEEPNIITVAWIGIMGSSPPAIAITLNHEPLLLGVDSGAKRVYCATIREYWRLGKRIGKGFNAGRHLHKRA